MKTKEEIEKAKIWLDINYGFNNPVNSWEEVLAEYADQYKNQPVHSKQVTREEVIGLCAKEGLLFAKNHNIKMSYEDFETLMVLITDALASENIINITK